MAERWTPERRRQHTRDLLMDAAEQVFARRGFEGASLEEIAQTAGYTRGAIYKNFGSKEELFLAANRRYNERFLETFAFPEGANLATTDLTLIARQWREMLERSGPEAMAMFLEFQLYLLRNPDARERLADQRRQFTEMVAGFIDEQSRHLGVTWRIPVTTVARLVLATADGITLARYLDPSEDDLYLPFLEALLSLWADGAGEEGRAAPG